MHLHLNKRRESVIITSPYRYNKKVMIKKPLRRALRLILFWLSRWALKKHEPKVITIVGEGKTAIVREAIYTILKTRFPTRRNIEYPDAEFVLPLTILGTKKYPRSILGWAATVLKSTAQLIILPKHKHFLVLEIGYARKETFDYFWKITNPKVLVVCGNAPYLSKDQKAKTQVKVTETEDLKGYFNAAARVAKLYGITKKEAESALLNFTLPKARIRVLPAKDGGVVVDASYEYFPPNQEALEEILEALPGKRTVLTPQDPVEKVKGAAKGEVAVVMGPSQKMGPVLLKLTKKSWI